MRDTERQKERQREKGRDAERQREREREKGRDTERQKEGERERLTKRMHLFKITVEYNPLSL